MSDVRTTLRLLARVLESLAGESEETLREIASGKVSLTVAKRKQPGTKERDVPDDRIPDVKARLGEARDRDEALRILQENCGSRKSLEQLARALDLPVQKLDSVERLMQRIVEATVGFRLRSDAIQGRIKLDSPSGEDVPTPRKDT